MDPSYETIAQAACVSVATVARALARLKAAALYWVRRCEEAEGGNGGGFIMRQISNLYGVAQATQWPATAGRRTRRRRIPIPGAPPRPCMSATPSPPAATRPKCSLKARRTIWTKP